MNSRERVIAVIEHRQPDRIPIHAWVRANLTDQITERFGSVDAFEDRYEFDLAHAFGGPYPYWGDDFEALKDSTGKTTPDRLLDYTLKDPNEESAYGRIREFLAHHKEQRGRFVYCQTPGIFEVLNNPFGIENHLAYLLMYKEELKEVYARQAQWNRQFALNCLDLGVDMVHVSDDWGSQRALMFRPEMWWEMIYPNHKVTADAVKKRGGYLSVHSDGYIADVVEGILDLGYDVAHPWQESAGMSLDLFRQKYRDRLTVMGGLDVQTTVGFGKLDFLKQELERVLGMFADGGLIFCTTHAIQNHCSMEELEFAFDLIHDLVRRA